MLTKIATASVFKTFSFGLFLLTLIGCAQQPDVGPPPVKTLKSQDVQEGIGGDIAALYVKGQAITSLKSLPYSDDLSDAEDIIRDLKIHSMDGLSSLYQKSGDVLFVDRQKVDASTPMETVSTLLEVIGYPELAKAVPSNTRELKLPTLRKQDLTGWHQAAGNFANTLPSMFGTNNNSGLHGKKMDKEAFVAAWQNEVMLAGFHKMDFRASDRTLLDSATKKEVDAVTVEVSEHIYVAWVNVKRIESLPRISQYAPLLLLHEASHVKTFSSNGKRDREYQFTEALLEKWSAWGM